MNITDNTLVHRIVSSPASGITLIAQDATLKKIRSIDLPFYNYKQALKIQKPVLITSGIVLIGGMFVGGATLVKHIIANLNNTEEWPPLPKECNDEKSADVIPLGEDIQPYETNTVKVIPVAKKAVAKKAVAKKAVAKKAVAKKAVAKKAVAKKAV